MKKRVISMILTVVMAASLLTAGPLTAFAATSGSWSSFIDTGWYTPDTANDPEFTLTSAGQLAGFAALANSGVSFQGKTVKLGADIDLSEHYWLPIGTSASPFQGMFDGQGHSITGLTISSSSATYQGLFAYNGGTIENVNLSYSITAYRYVGGIVAYNSSQGTVSGCAVSGTLQAPSSGAERLGGVVGENYGTVDNCSSSAAVSVSNTSANTYGVGGVVGNNLKNISGCTNTGGVSLSCTTTSALSELSLGGIVGRNSGAAAVVEFCVNTGSVEGHLEVTKNISGSNKTASINAGGVAGVNINGAAVRNCYNMGNVYLSNIKGISTTLRHTTSQTSSSEGSGDAVGYGGGIAGANGNAALTENCYNTGSVGGHVANSFSTSSVSSDYVRDTYRRGSVYAGKIVGQNNLSSGSGGYGTINSCYWLGSSGNSVTTIQSIIGSRNVSLGGSKSSIGRFSGVAGALIATDGTSLGTYKVLFDALYYSALDTAVKADPNFEVTKYIWAETDGYPGFKKITGWADVADTRETLAIGIGNAMQLAGLAKLVNGGNSLAGKTFTLAANLNISRFPWTPAGTAENPFAGTFVGGGKAIYGLNIDTDDDYQGLFGNVSGAVRDVILRNAIIRGGDRTGGISGQSSGSLSGCSVWGGGVKGLNDVGGIVGYQEGGGIVSCSASGKVEGASNVGGIAGRMDGGAISQSFSAAEVTAIQDAAGGIAGALSGGTLRDSRNDGPVSSAGGCAGGLSGRASAAAEILNSHNSGAIKAADSAGGVAGESSSARIENCYSTGATEGAGSAGGLVGTNSGSLRGGYYLKSAAENGVGSGTGTAESVGSFRDSTGALTAADGTALGYGATLFEALSALRESTEGSWPGWKIHEIINGGYPTLDVSYPRPGNWGLYADTDWYSSNPEQASFTLTSVRELAGLAYLVSSGISFEGKTIALGADIDVSTYYWAPIGRADGSAFKGTFDGQGHIISGLGAADASARHQGLFGNNAGTVKNVGLNELSIVSEAFSAGIAGNNGVTGRILNCFVRGSISGTTYSGGIVSYNYGLVENCYFAGVLSGNMAGGAVGQNFTGGVVRDCHFQGTDAAVGRSEGGTEGANHPIADRKALLAELNVWADSEDGRNLGASYWKDGGALNGGYPIFGYDEAMLEELLLSLGGHNVIVVAKDGALPIEGADVVIAEKELSAVTDERGVAECAGVNGTYSVRVSAEGYKTTEQFYRAAPGNERYFFLEEKMDDGKPYITFAYDKRSRFDLRTQSLAYSEKKGDVLELAVSGDWNGNGPGNYKLYQEGVKGGLAGRYIMSEDGVFDFAPGKALSPEQPVFLMMVSANGVESDPVPLNLIINKQSEMDMLFEASDAQPVLNITTDNSASILESAFLNMFPSRYMIPKIGKLVNVHLVTNADGSHSLRGTVGADKSPAEKKNPWDGIWDATTGSDAGWKGYKGFFDEQTHYYIGGGTQKSFATARNAGFKTYGVKLYDFTMADVVKAEALSFGYFELTFDLDGKLRDSGGKMLMAGRAFGSYTKNFQVFYIPVYVQLEGGMKMGFLAGLDISGSGISVSKDSRFVLSPYIILEAGIGNTGVFSVGVGGGLDLRIQVMPTNSGDLEAYAYVRLRALKFIDLRWTFAQKSWHLWGSKSARMAAYGLAQALENGELELTLADRSYASKTTAWNGSGEVLQSWISPDASPRLARAGGKTVMLLDTDDPALPAGNSTRLKYSVYDGASWTEPRPVWESATADYQGKLVTAGGELYAVWQKSKAAATEKAADRLLTEMAGNLEICVAKWNKNTEKFENQQFVTSNDRLDMAPVLASDGDNLSALWVQSSANDVFGLSGTYSIMRSTLENGSWSAPVRLFETEDYITELAAGYKDGSLSVAYAVAGGEDKPDIWLVRGSSSIPISDMETASALQFKDGDFYWSAGGEINVFNPSDNTSETIKTADGSAISGSWKIAEGGGRMAVVWAEANRPGDETDAAGSSGYSLKASIKTSGGWSAPVTLKETDNNIRDFDAVLDDSGTWLTAMNTCPEPVIEDDADNWEEPEHSLRFAEIIPRTDLSLDYAYADSSLREGTVQPVVCYVTNLGEKAVSSLKLEISGMAAKTIPCDIDPGETVILAENVDLRDVPADGKVTVMVSAAEETELPDNSFELTLGVVDVSLSLERYDVDGKVFVAAKLNNASEIPANVALTVRRGAKDGPEIDRKPEAVLGSGHSRIYLFSFDPSSEDFGDADRLPLYFAAEVREANANPYSDTGVIVLYKKVPYEKSDEEPVEIKLVKATGISIQGPKSIALHTDMEEVSGVQLSAAVAPTGVTNGDVFWSSSDQEVAAVSGNGLVVAIGPGTAEITAASLDGGFTDTVTVTVSQYYHNLTVKSSVGGKITAGADGAHAAGDRVAVAAEPYDGYRFSGWVSSGGRFENAASISTAFDMPEEDVTVTAMFEPIRLIKVITPVVSDYVATLGANVKVLVDGEELIGRDVHIYLSRYGTVLGSAPVADGVGTIKIPAGVLNSVGRYDLTATVDGVDCGITGHINVVAYNPELWSMAFAKSADGMLMIVFADRISVSPNGLSVDIGNEKGVGYAGLAEGDVLIRTVKGFEDIPAGTVIVVKGLKYPSLFPSYSFTFTGKFGG